MKELYYSSSVYEACYFGLLSLKQVNLFSLETLVGSQGNISVVQIRCWDSSTECKRNTHVGHKKINFLSSQSFCYNTDFLPLRILFHLLSQKALKILVKFLHSMPYIHFPVRKDPLPEYNSLQSLDFHQDTFLLIFSHVCFEIKKIVIKYFSYSNNR